MQKIFSLFLLAGIFMGMSNASAKKDDPKTIKAATAATAKKPDAAKEGKAADPVKKPASPDDTMSNPGSFFYEVAHQRPVNIQDIYLGIGGGYISGNGGNKAPFKNGLAITAMYGTPMLNKYLLLEYCNNANFLYSPNKEWFSKAFSLPQPQIKGMNMGFSDDFTIGVGAVIVGSRKFSWTAGVQGGAMLTIMPSMTLGTRLYFLSSPLSFCYGAKTNVYIGNNVYCFAQYANSTLSNVVANISPASSDAAPVTHSQPVSFGVIRVGVTYILKPWWHVEKI